MPKLVVVFLLVFNAAAAFAGHAGEKKGEHPAADPCAGKGKSLQEAAEKGWELVNPRFFLQPPLDGYKKVVVLAKYGSENPRLVGAFSPPFDFKKGAAVEWNVDKKLPEKEQFRIQYQVQVVDEKGKSLDSGWLSTDRATTCLSPKTWRGSRAMPAEIDATEMKKASASYALVKFQWKDRDGTDASRTIIWQEKNGVTASGVLDLHWSEAPLGLTASMSYRRNGETVTVPATPVAVTDRDGRVRLTVSPRLALQRAPD